MTGPMLFLIGRSSSKARGRSPDPKGGGLLPIGRGKPHIACNEGLVWQARLVTRLTVRNVSAQIVRMLKQRAAAHGRSAEAEHREILREALLEGEEDFATRAKALRRRLRSPVDSSDVIRTDRDRDTAG